MLTDCRARLLLLALGSVDPGHALGLPPAQSPQGRGWQAGIKVTAVVTLCSNSIRMLVIYYHWQASRCLQVPTHNQQSLQALPAHEQRCCHLSAAVGVTRCVLPLLLLLLLLRQ